MTHIDRLRYIFHPTDLQAGSDVAFFHALRLTVAANASLTILHVKHKDEEVNMGSLPHVRDTLIGWRIISGENGAEELAEMGVGVRKIVESGAPVEVCLDHLDRHPADLTVLHTTQREGRSTWLAPRVSEPLARHAGGTVLLVPEGVPGFVDSKSGDVRLTRILIPVASRPSPQRSVDMAAAIANALGAKEVEFRLLHVGDEGDMPHVHTPEGIGWNWSTVVKSGSVVDTILHEEREFRPDLLVMTTQGHDGFLDGLRGSTTERVLRHIHCPLLTAVSSE